MLSLGLQEFMPMSHVIKLAKSSIKEQNLRHEYPMLNELWLQYQTMLRIVSNGE
jgi:hypothetical protein